MSAARAASCRTCRAFNRADLHLPAIEGAHPAQAQCRRAPPPWPIVHETDWCLAHLPTRVPVAPDDGA